MHTFNYHILFFGFLLNVPLCAMDVSQKIFGVAPLKQLAAFRATHLPMAQILRLPLELQSLVAYHKKWNALNETMFSAQPLNLAKVQFCSDNHSVMGVDDRETFFYIDRNGKDLNMWYFPAALLSHYARHPHHSWLIAIFFRDTNSCISFFDARDYRRGHRSAQLGNFLGALRHLQWSANGSCIMVASNRQMHFVTPKIKDVWLPDGELRGYYTIRTLAPAQKELTHMIISPSGEHSSFASYEYDVPFLGMYDLAYDRTINVPVTPLPVSLDYEYTNENHLMVATENEICRIPIVHYDYEGPFPEIVQECTINNEKAQVNQVLCLSNKFLLIKLLIKGQNPFKRVLTLFDRSIKKALVLSHVVCEGKLSLSKDRNFVYGDKKGDSLVDLSPLNAISS